jgi:hypothetical protein
MNPDRCSRGTASLMGSIRWWPIGLNSLKLASRLLKKFEDKTLEAEQHTKKLARDKTVSLCKTFLIIFPLLPKVCYDGLFICLKRNRGFKSDTSEVNTKRALNIFATIMMPSITPRSAWKRISERHRVRTPAVTVAAV